MTDNCQGCAKKKCLIGFLTWPVGIIKKEERRTSASQSKEPLSEISLSKRLSFIENLRLLQEDVITYTYSILGFGLFTSFIWVYQRFWGNSFSLIWVLTPYIAIQRRGNLTKGRRLGCRNLFIQAVDSIFAAVNQDSSLLRLQIGSLRRESSSPLIGVFLIGGYQGMLKEKDYRTAHMVFLIVRSLIDRPSGHSKSSKTTRLHNVMYSSSISGDR